MAEGFTGAYILTGVIGETETDSVQDMVERIAQVVGGENDPEVEKLAYDALREFVDDVNIRQHFDFLSVQQPDFDLTESVRSYTLAEDFYAMQAVQLIKTTGEDAGIHRNLEWRDWTEFADLYEVQKTEALPEVWSIRAPYDGAGSLELYPIPDSDAAANYDLRVTYYKRLEQVTNSPVARIQGPRELTAAALAYGRMHVLSIRRPEHVALIDRQERLWRDRLVEFFNIREKTTRGPIRMKLGSSGRFVRYRGTLGGRR